jgi:hypothetical protein
LTVWVRNPSEQVGAYQRRSQPVISADTEKKELIGYCVRLWKVALQALANETHLTVRVCHCPPGTSKWNKMEHRMLSFISLLWRGKPLISGEVVVNLIGNTRSATGLSIRAEVDTTKYPKGIKVSDEDLRKLNLTRHDCLGERN